MLDIPGFVDLQVNGYLGVDFSSEDLDEAGLVRSWRALIKQGTVAFLPTLITSPVSVYRQNLPLIARVMMDAEFRGHVLGIHLEGPFISAEQGAVGAHDPRYVRGPDPTLLRQLLAWGEGQVRMLTLAAELPGAAELAGVALERGVAVSIGHSLFDVHNLDALCRAGARSLTHLGNGLPNLLPRHPNPIWDGLAHDGYTAMLIADGHHLPDSLLRVAMRAKGAERIVVVSDAAPVAGMPPGVYDVLGNRAVLHASGLLYNPDKQCLVGSTATMLACMNTVAALDLYSLAEMVAIGFENPLRLIGVQARDVVPAHHLALEYSGGRFALLQT